jgi:putative transposase
MAAVKISWPHAPTHQLSSRAAYFLTAGTYLKAHYFRDPERLDVLQRGILKLCQDFGWHLEAWAVFSNHYHWVAHSPATEEDAANLRTLLGILHTSTARWVNRLDGTPNRQVWHNYWDTRLTYQLLVFGPPELRPSESGETRSGARGESVSLVLGRMV